MPKFIRILIAFLFFPNILFFSQTPQPPSNVTANGFENHIYLEWEKSPSNNVANYEIQRSTDGGQSFTWLKNVGATQTFLTDWTGDEGQNLTRHYQIRALATNGEMSAFTPNISAQTQAMNDEALLEMVQRQTFRYFWEYAHPVSGLARERTGSNEIVTSGGSGFGIMALVCAAERGWVSRAEAVGRMIQIVSFLQIADRFHGVFPHWLNGETGDVIPFSQQDDGGDLVETAFLMQGLLTARAYFDQTNPEENAVRDAITDLWEGVEWDWYQKNNSQVLYWHWSPNYGWAMNFPLRGFFEAQIVYLLAVASPTHPVPGSLYQSGWTSSNYANPSVHFGQPIFCGPFGGGPMFFAHYSYLGFDPRLYKDVFCNYFVRNRSHALIQHAYAVANPENHIGYSADCWGLTACDGPNGYAAHDIYPANDNGTIAPTAALASMPYTPNESMAALRHFYRQQGERLWGNYGFYDAFNLDVDWFANSYLAIDQGPIVAMLENHRTGLLWEKFMQNPEIQVALEAMGFVPDNSALENPIENGFEQRGFTANLFPNPVSSRDGTFQMEVSVLRPQELTVQVFDLFGKPLGGDAVFSKHFSAGISVETLRFPGLAAGMYVLKVLGTNGQIQTLTFVVLRS